MNTNDHIDIACHNPEFKPVFRLKEDFKDLKKGTLLVQSQFYRYYTVRGWYADKDSKASKEYKIYEPTDIALLEFDDFYQIRGKRVHSKYLYDLLPAKYKKD